MASNVYKLRCDVQTYAWGKLGMDSEVARLAKLADPDFTVDEQQPYAELWMGAHPKAPSKLLSNGAPLSEFVQNNPSTLGDKVLKLFRGELPFLFKVLSVNKSLSIQAHPDKPHAEKLHAERPDIYKDPNHKPEMAIALTLFEGLCGFRPLKEIQDFLRSVPELRAVVGSTNADNLCSCTSDDEAPQKLKQCFESLMKCDPETRRAHLESLVMRVSKLDKSSDEFQNTFGELLLRLNSQFPGDVGCFVIYFLNHIKLSPGEAMFLSANVPHAYLDGNCIECMACSDNVVRAGLTPKLIDVPTLCEMLEYVPSSIEARKYQYKQNESDPYLKIYNPPIDDFAVHCVTIPSDITSYTFAPVDSPSILLILDGKGSLADMPIHGGAVFFTGANAELNVALDGCGLRCFRALCMLD